MDMPTILGFAVLGVSVVGSSSAGLVWAIRQEGRINTHDEKFDAIEKITDEREDNAQTRHKELLDRFTELEKMIRRGRNY